MRNITYYFYQTNADNGVLMSDGRYAYCTGVRAGKDITSGVDLYQKNEYSEPDDKKTLKELREYYQKNKDDLWDLRDVPDMSLLFPFIPEDFECLEELVTFETEYEIFWSVESEVNSYNDDEFCGTYEECVEYARKEGYNNENCQIALIQSKDGIFDFCYDVKKEWCDEPELDEPDICD